MAESLRADRGLRRHRRPPHGRAGGHGRLDRLPVPSRASTRRRSSRRCSTPSAAAASRSRRSSASAARKQLYLPDTNVLLTRFLSDDGVAEVSDFMPVEDAGQAHNLVRRAKTVRGEVRFRMLCAPRFDYARATHTVERRGDREVALRRPRRGRPAGPAAALVGAAAAWRTAPPWPSSRSARTSRPRSCSRWCCRTSHRRRRQPDYESEAFKQTVNFWRALDRPLAPTRAAGARW